MRWQSATLNSLHELARARCDVCGATPQEGPHSPRTFGMYLWAREGQLIREQVPLCSACSAAVGLTLLARANIEEEEG